MKAQTVTLLQFAMIWGVLWGGMFALAAAAYDSDTWEWTDLFASIAFVCLIVGTPILFVSAIITEAMGR